VQAGNFGKYSLDAIMYDLFRNVPESSIFSWMDIYVVFGLVTFYDSQTTKTLFHVSQPCSVDQGA
jgi:hypothetical protein